MPDLKNEHIYDVETTVYRLRILYKAGGVAAIIAAFMLLIESLFLQSGLNRQLPLLILHYSKVTSSLGF